MTYPIDFGPRPKAKDRNEQLLLWDYDSDKKSHPLFIKKEQFIDLAVLEEEFDPHTFENGIQK